MVLSTGEMVGRMVRFGLVGCSVCHKEYLITNGIVDFVGSVPAPPPPHAAPRLPPPDAATIQALLELSGPGGFIVLVGDATRHAAGLGALMAGVHFVGINAPSEMEELPVLSLLRVGSVIPLRQAIARGVVVGRDLATSSWLVEALRVLLRGRRLVVEHDRPELPIGLEQLAVAKGLWVGEKK